MRRVEPGRPLTKVPPRSVNEAPEAEAGSEALRPGQVRAGQLSQARAYEGITESALALLLPIGLGYWLDGYFGSRPVGVLVGVVLGFAAMMVRLVRWTRVPTGSPPGDDGPGGGEHAGERSED